MRADRRHIHGEHHRGQVPESQLEEAAAFGGGTGFTSPLTTKGDVYGHSTVDARIPIGTDGQVLTADSGQTLGLKWATPSGGITRTHYGYDTIGGTSAGWSDGETVMKKITPGAGWLAGLAVYVQGGADNVPALMPGIWSDSSGSPKYLIASGANGDGANQFVLGLSSSGPWDARWMWMPIGMETAAATDYWIGAQKRSGTLSYFYDSGSDRHFTAGGWWLADAGRYTDTDSTHKFSLYAVVLT